MVITAEEVIDAAEKVLAEEKDDVRKSHKYQQLCADTAYNKTIHQIKRIKQSYPLYLTGMRKNISISKFG